MNYEAMINELTAKAEELRRNAQAYTEEKERCMKRLDELQDLLDPIKADIEGLEMAIEALSTTSLIKTPIDENEVQAVDVLTENQKNSLESKPAPKVKEKKSRKARRVYQFGANNVLIKSFPSMMAAQTGLRWTHKKLEDTLAIPKDTQIHRNGFYVTSPMTP